MPTIRSVYSFEQFEEQFQKLAHKIAIKAVRKGSGDVRIVIRHGRFTTVETDGTEIYFRGKRISYCTSSKDWSEWWSFDVEEKIYLTSNHRTKISFETEKGKEKEVEGKVKKFVEKLMEDVEVIPRFSLVGHARKSNRKLTDYKAFTKRKRRKS